VESELARSCDEVVAQVAQLDVASGFWPGLVDRSMCRRNSVLALAGGASTEAFLLDAAVEPEPSDLADGEAAALDAQQLTPLLKRAVSL
jgi:hypothetical protein